MLAGWPALRALSVNGCIGLHRLSLAGQPNLERLEASGCKRLAALACASPLLQTLLAQACPRLQASPAPPLLVPVTPGCSQMTPECVSS